MLVSRFALIVCGILTFLVTVALLCGPNTLSCLTVISTDGVIAFAWLIGATAAGAVVLRQFQLRLNIALFIATAGGLGLGIFSMLGLGFGLIGKLNGPIAIALPVLSVVLLGFDSWRKQKPGAPGKPQSLPTKDAPVLELSSNAGAVLDYAHGRMKFADRNRLNIWLAEFAGFAWVWLIPVVSLAIAAVAASMMPGLLWKPLDPHPYDVTSYHLLVPREWYEGGRIVPLQHNVFSYFPFNVEMQYLLLMHATGGPWAAMCVCQFLSVGYAGLMVLAVVGACASGKRSTFNAQRSTFKLKEPQLESWKLKVERWTFAPPAFGAILAATVPWTIMLAGVAYVESALMLYTALAVAWTLYSLSHPQTFLKASVVAGLMSGFACGVKITAVPMLMLAIPVALLLLLIRKAPEFPSKKILIGCTVFAFSASLILSPWLIRNFVWARNPLFPIAMNMLGRGHFTAEQVARFSIAHSPIESQKSLGSRLQIVSKDILGMPSRAADGTWPLNGQFGWLLLPIGLVAIAINHRKRQAWLLLICGLFVFVTWIGFTHLLPRFLVMLIPIAAMAAGQIHWGRLWPIAIFLLLIAAIGGWSFVVPELIKQSNPPPFQGQPRPAFFGNEFLKYMTFPEMTEARDSHLEIGLVGDAQAFLYQVPMAQMHYRSVFDVATDQTDPIDAWIGPQVRGDPRWLLVINPMEIDRLHRTYKDIPPLPPQYEADLEKGLNVFLRGDQVPGK